MSNISVGKTGENLACTYLRKKGYQILSQNYYTHWGELDVVASIDNKISFIEVKTRVGDKKGKPYEAVTQRKVGKLLRAIQYYIKQNNVSGKRYSLDVVSILLSENHIVKSINHYTDLPLETNGSW